MKRQFLVHTSLSDSSLLFKSLKGREKLSEAYEFEIELLSNKRLSNPIDLHNKTLTVEIKNKSTPTRYLSGYIEKISYAPFYQYDDRLYLYTAIVRPKLWELKQRLGYGIWQDKTVPDIVTEVLSKAGILFKNQLIEKYCTWEYCVKYNETDFDFIHRLMEQEGIYYYFKHDMGNHTLILVDVPQLHEPMPGYETIQYLNTRNSLKEHLTEYIYSWNVSSITVPNTYSLDNYDFRKPRADLHTTIQSPIGSIDNSEIFIYPERHVESEQGQFYARIRRQAVEAESELISGKGNVLGMAPGHTFTLSLPSGIKGDDHGDYLIIGTQYFLYEKPDITDPANEVLNTVARDLSNSDTTQNNIQFEAIPVSTHWKPLPVTPWPKVAGLETAVVTGSKDKKTWIDHYGRIKVKFHWNKDDKDQKDDTCSCWIRVATHWAGQGHGSISIPRIEDEVVISFVNGDPNKPLVIGSVYNDENMPPWELPKYETRFGIMSKQANHLFLDDELNNELIDIHAARDMNISVKKDQKVTIDGDWVQNITGETNISSPKSITIKSDTKVKIDTPTLHTTNKDYNISITDFLNLSWNRLSNMSFNGINISGNGVNVSTNGVSVSGNVLSTSFNVFSFSRNKIEIRKKEISANIVDISIKAINFYLIA